MSSYSQITAVRDALSSIAGVATCEIGIEANITAASYPIIRVVPSVLRPQNQGMIERTGTEVLVYYGELSYAFEDGGLEAQYEWLLNMEAEIRSTLTLYRIDYTWIDTVMDEDRMPGYKLFASRILVRGC